MKQVKLSDSYPTHNCLTENFSLRSILFVNRRFFSGKTVLEAVGSLDLNLHYVMDYDFWIRLSRNVRVPLYP